VRNLNPDTLQPASGEELRERQCRTGESREGRIVFCQPDLLNPEVIQQVSRATCVATPYFACLSCRHHRFEYIFEAPGEESWVLCPRWKREAGTGPPDYCVPVGMSECRAKPHVFCPQCPSREELDEILTDKQKEGWLDRYRKLLRED
jgi:hypothetical protein